MVQIMDEGEAIRRLREGHQAAADRQREVARAEGPHPEQAVREALDALDALSEMGMFPAPRDPSSEREVAAVRCPVPPISTSAIPLGMIRVRAPTNPEPSVPYARCIAGTREPQPGFRSSELVKIAGTGQLERRFRFLRQCLAVRRQRRTRRRNLCDRHGPHAVRRIHRRGLNSDRARWRNRSN